MATSTQNVGPANIPVVNFSLLSSGAPQERNESLKQLDDAFQTYGFIYLSNHSIPQEMVAEALHGSSILLLRRFALANPYSPNASSISHITSSNSLRIPKVQLTTEDLQKSASA